MSIISNIEQKMSNYEVFFLDIHYSLFDIRYSDSNVKVQKGMGTIVNRFVIQEHHATHLHWDFRLELDGVLKSWAIPKEPGKIPGKKYLAIQVEDHDLDYIDYEGEIEEGDYGAGKVLVWDNGTFDLLERSENKLIFTLHGKKLKGDFCLIRFKKAGEKQWLFFEKKAKK